MADTIINLVTLFQFLLWIPRPISAERAMQELAGVIVRSEQPLRTTSTQVAGGALK